MAERGADMQIGKLRDAEPVQCVRQAGDLHADFTHGRDAQGFPHAVAGQGQCEQHQREGPESRCGPLFLMPVENFTLPACGAAERPCEEQERVPHHEQQEQDG